jgi:hypothetical protein
MSEIGTTVAGGLLGMIGGHQQERRNYRNNLNLMNQQYGNQRALNKQGHDMQMDMWNKTNYGAQVGHMKDAGLNPALMYKGAGAGGTTGSQGGGSASMGSSSQGKVMDLSNALMAAQVGKLKAETNNLNQGKKNKGGEFDNIIKTGNLIDAQELKTINEAELKGFEAEIKSIDANWLRDNNLSTMSIKELKLINEATGGGLQYLMDVLGDRAKEVGEVIEDPIGKGKKVLNTAQEKINAIYEALKNKLKQ